MSANFNEICQRLGCELEDGHWARSAEAPDGMRIVFAVRGEQIDWNTGTCMLFPASTGEPNLDPIPGKPDPVLFGKYHAELCAMDPAIEAFGVVCKPGGGGRPTVDAERVLRLRVERKDDGGYVGRIVEQLPIASIATR